MKPELKVAAFGIAIIGILEGLALATGVDGTMYGATMAAIGGIVGWIFKNIRSGGGVL